MGLRIDGNTFADMLKNGISVLSQHEKELNDLNVFPVADGDTGSNMLKTAFGGLNAIKDEANSPICSLSDSFANGTLLFARGNSGVILSQIFSGMAKALTDCETADVTALLSAYKNAIQVSYRAVQNPTEGTMLTVFREGTEYVENNLDKINSVEDFFKYHFLGAEKSLKNTKNILPALAEADVVDSGGAGYLCIAKGMYDAISRQTQSITLNLKESENNSLFNVDGFTRDSVLQFGYCTEFLLRLTTSKVDPDEFDIQTVLNDLKALKGESVVALKNGDIVKVHVHTFTPGAVLSKMQEYGEFLTLKIENMALEHTNNQKNKASESVQTEKVKTPKKKFSIVSVCSGDGMTDLFKKMGVDYVLLGGDNANPSVKDFLDVFSLCNSESIIVLPNNKNIILAVESAQKLYDKAQIHIIESKNMGQGFSALSVITPGMKDVDAIVKSAKRAIEDSVCAEITQAVRNTKLNGIDVEKGQYIAISGGKLVASTPSAEQSVISFIEQSDADSCEILTIFKGCSVNDENCDALVKRLERDYCDLQIEIIDGGQEVYDYIVVLE